MAELDLNEALNKPETDADAGNEALPEKRTDTSLSTENAFGEGLTGEFSSQDIKLPTLNIVHGVGPLSEEFTPGSLVYNKELVLVEGSPKGTTDPVELVVVAARKQYQENLEWGSEAIPALVDTMEEVKAMGGTTAWGADGEEPSWVPILRCLLLIEGNPDNPGFDYCIEDKYYAPAMWTLKGAAYNRAGKNIITAGRMGLRKGLAYGRWHLRVRREKMRDNFVFVPQLTQAGKNTDEFVQLVHELGMTF